MPVLLEVIGAHSYYGSNHVVFGLNLNVMAGEVVILLGRNGAGKSTTLKGIMGVHRFRSGSVRFRGQEIGGLSQMRCVALVLGMCPRTVVSSKVCPLRKTSRRGDGRLASAVGLGTSSACLNCFQCCVIISGVAASY